MAGGTRSWGDGQREDHVKGRGEAAPPGVRFSDISVLYGAMQVALSRRVRQSTAWYCVARRGVTDATWSGLASEIWFNVHRRAIIVGCVGEGGNLRLSGALNFIYT